MTPWRTLLLGLTLVATVLFLSLPAVNAQLPCCCSGGMQVHTYHIYMQRQQSVVQQMQQMQQMQMQQMQQMQQARHFQMMQQHLTNQMRQVHQQANMIAMQTRQMNMQTQQLHTQSRQLFMQSRHLNMHTGLLGQTPRTLHNTALALHTQSRQLYTVPKHLTMQSRSLHQQSRQLNTTARALHMQTRQLHTDARQLNQQSRQLYTQSRSLNTKTQYCTQEITVTVVTWNLKCGQCHQNQMPTPLSVPGKPQLPNLVMNPTPRMPMNPMPRMPNPLNLNPLPQLPNMVNVQPMPNMLPNPKRPLLELWARPRQLPNMLPPQRPVLPNLMGLPPGPLVLNEPVLPGPMQPLLAEPWAAPRQFNRPIATRKTPLDFAMTPSQARTPSKPKLREPLRNGESPMQRPALTDLKEGIAVAETSQPLPSEVLQAPALPVGSSPDAGYRRGLSGEDAGVATEAEVDAVPRSPSLLADADLQAPDLPELPLSVLELPPPVEASGGLEDPNQAPELPEFTPSAPDPIASSGQGQPAQPRTARITAEGALSAPSLPSLPLSVLGPG